MADFSIQPSPGVEGLRARIREGAPILLDAAMGTQLERNGAPARLPLWSARALMENPELVLAIHRAEAAAGAEILTANTFRTHRRTLAREGLEARSAELTRMAVALAREAARGAGRPVFVVGSLSPLEDCYRPDLTPDGEALEREHAMQAESLAAAGVDGIFVETQNTVREMAAATRWAKATGLPVIASMITDGRAISSRARPSKRPSGRSRRSSSKLSRSTACPPAASGAISPFSLTPPPACRWPPMGTSARRPVRIGESSPKTFRPRTTRSWPANGSPPAPASSAAAAERRPPTLPPCDGCWTGPKREGLRSKV